MAQTERAKCYYITIPGMIQGQYRTNELVRWRMHFFVRCDCRNRRFTGGKSRFLQEADGRKGIASAADELCGSAQGKISAERGKIAQNQPIRRMISADGGAAVGFREISLPLLYRIRRDVRGTNCHSAPRPATSSAKSPRYSPSVHHQGKRATARPILSFRCFCLAKRRAIWYDEISRNRVLTP